LQVAQLLHLEPVCNMVYWPSLRIWLMKNPAELADGPTLYLR